MAAPKSAIKAIDQPKITADITLSKKMDELITRLDIRSKESAVTTDDLKESSEIRKIFDDLFSLMNKPTLPLAFPRLTILSESLGKMLVLPEALMETILTRFIAFCQKTTVQASLQLPILNSLMNSFAELGLISYPQSHMEYFRPIDKRVEFISGTFTALAHSLYGKQYNETAIKPIEISKNVIINLCANISMLCKIFNVRKNSNDFGHPYIKKALIGFLTQLGSIFWGYRHPKHFLRIQPTEQVGKLKFQMTSFLSSIGFDLSSVECTSSEGTEMTPSVDYQFLTGSPIFIPQKLIIQDFTPSGKIGNPSKSQNDLSESLVKHYGLKKSALKAESQRFPQNCGFYTNWVPNQKAADSVHYYHEAVDGSYAMDYIFILRSKELHILEFDGKPFHSIRFIPKNGAICFDHSNGKTLAKRAHRLALPLTAPFKKITYTNISSSFMGNILKVGQSETLATERINFLNSILPDHGRYHGTFTCECWRARLDAQFILPKSISNGIVPVHSAAGLPAPTVKETPTDQVKTQAEVTIVSDVKIVSEDLATAYDSDNDNIGVNEPPSDDNDLAAVAPKQLSNSLQPAYANYKQSAAPNSGSITTATNSKVRVQLRK